MTGGRRLLIPEVVQTSVIDCGPAALMSLAAGFGIPAEYGRLREACQTEVDGTSIDALEEVANLIGLDAEQVMLPPDCLLIPEAQAIPSLVVTRSAENLTHFVVIWRKVGRWVQVMDPASGRRWVREDRLLNEIYVHEMGVPAAAWREWAGSPDARRMLSGKLSRLVGAADARPMEDAAAADPSWRGLARVEAVARMLDVLVSRRAVRRGPEAARSARLLERAARDDASAVPDRFWSVRVGETEDDVVLRGAVLLRVRGRRDEAPDPELIARRSPLLARSLQSSRPSAARAVLDLVRGEPLVFWVAIASALVVASGAVFLEALVLRGAIEMGQYLTGMGQRIQAVGYLLAFAAALLLVECGFAASVTRLGRKLEIRLRARLLEKIPRIQERYFQTRPVSDLAERGHAIHATRWLPRWAGQALFATLRLLVTAVGIVWLLPASWPVVLVGLGLTLSVPFILLPILEERDLRLRTHAGGLVRFFSDSLLGLRTIASHGAESVLHREHNALLTEWMRAGISRMKAAAFFDGTQGVITTLIAVAILFVHATSGADAGTALLLIYWSLHFNAFGGEIGFAVRSFPRTRTIVLRVLDPLGAPEDSPVEIGGDPGLAAPPAATTAGVDLTLEHVTVRAGQSTILSDVSLRVPPGEHLALLGPSGAGKSTMIGLFLGWNVPSQGFVRADGAELTGAAILALRQETVWIDPSIQIWNRSLLENLLYGSDRGAGQLVESALREADLMEVLQRLPAGLQSPLGENGGLLSGGEGQRVRIARALLRRRPRLVLLDEAFRGLDRSARERMSDELRRRWPGTTVVCVTHDVSVAERFDRVAILEDGGIVEQGTPDRLSLDPVSHFSRYLASERGMRREVWDNPLWKRLHMEEGRARTVPPAALEEPALAPVVRTG